MSTWLEDEYGGALVVYGHRVLSISHLPGVKAILREEVEDNVLLSGAQFSPSLSAIQMDCYEAGLSLNEQAMRERIGVTQDTLSQYLPIECPHLALTKRGVLRPWSGHMAFSKGQAYRLHLVLSGEFWRAVETFDASFALKVSVMCDQSQLDEGAGTSSRHKKPYTAIDMITEFCADTGTNDIYIPELRREWQRRMSRRKKS